MLVGSEGVEVLHALQESDISVEILGLAAADSRLFALCQSDLQFAEDFLGNFQQSVTLDA